MLRKRGEQEGWTFTVGLNEATQYPLTHLCGTATPAGPAPPPQSLRPPALGSELPDLPVAFDWRDDPSGGCTPIRHQGYGPYCWAFATIGVLESAILIHRGESVDLSEQWLISCTDRWYYGFAHCSCLGTPGDDGQLGPILEEDCPYEASWTYCQAPYPVQSQYRMNSWSWVADPENPTVEQIKSAIFQHGPVRAHVQTSSAFHAYTDGVFNCDQEGGDHVVVLVGWDDTQGSNGVWFLRNSWGTGWGEDGYMRIEYGCSGVGGWAIYVDYPGPDCNSNGLQDCCEIGDGTSQDANANLVPDECEDGDAERYCQISLMGRLSGGGLLGFFSVDELCSGDDFRQ